MTCFFRAILLFFCGMLCCFTATAQVHPKDGAHLNYTSICFAFPWAKNAVSYELQLTSDATKKSHTFTFGSNKYVISGLRTGGSYTWSYAGKDALGKTVFQSQPQHFAIDAPKAGEQFLRFQEVTYNKALCGPELLVFDYALLAVNRNRETVWYMPPAPFIGPASGVRDLKLTDDGTFLAIIDSIAYELNIDGTVRWKAPNDGSVSRQKTEDYHHDVQKLASGNYMVLGNEKVRHRFPGETDSVRYESGTIIEYNPQGKVVWEWHAKDFFTEELLMLRRKADGTVDPATHMNAFHVSGNYIYAGFRDASWLLKIDKRSKEVVEIYGGHASGLPHHYGKELFHYQHGAELLRDGSMAIVNNDSVKNPKTFSSLVVFSLGEKGRDKGEELFRFPFNYDTLTSGKSTKLGNVTQLKNGNYLVNMGAINRVFEVTPDGEVVWDFLIEKLDTFKSVWQFAPQYRVTPTPSLYPNEATAKAQLESSNGKLLGEVTVYNVGSETNSYTLFLQRDGKTPLEVAKIPALATNESKTVRVSFPQEKNPFHNQLFLQVDGKSKRIWVDDRW